MSTKKKIGLGCGIAVGIVIIGFILLMVFATVFSNKVNENMEAAGIVATTSIETIPKEDIVPAEPIVWGTAIVLDNFEVVFHNDFSLVTIDNRYDEHNGQDAIRIPVTVTNTSNETNSPWVSLDVDVYGPDGLAIKTFSSYFDDAPANVPSMRSGATQDMAIYALYVGPGEYCIEVNDWLGWNDAKELLFTID